jgi:ABC-2 type transport system permease protein
MLTHDSLVVEQRALQPAKQHAVLRGWANLLRKEQGVWWGTRKWLVHLLLWPLLLNGFVVLLTFTLSKEPALTAIEIAQQVTTLFFLISALAAAFGAVVATQGAVVGEKQRGTAAWIMSKPVSRRAFVLAKLVGQATGFLSLAVVLPSVIFYGQCLILWGRLPNPVAFLGSVLIVMLHVLFYLALTLMLGTLFRGSGPVAGMALGGLLGGMFVQERSAKLAVVMPWELPDIAGLLQSPLITEPLLRTLALPIVATAGWGALFIAVALWRFEREQF